MFSFKGFYGNAGYGAGYNGYGSGYGAASGYGGGYGAGGYGQTVMPPLHIVILDMAAGIIVLLQIVCPDREAILDMEENKKLNF
uniref:Uncharacterized protein n=1 Tax=Meloidogyne javanica TaxID=6303 RepID=A0A915MYQ0_MELJA